MSGSRRTLVVIGGGMAGVSLAGRAVELFDTTVLEAESQPAYHSSGRSAAVAIECYENDVIRELTLPGLDYQRAHGAKPIGCLTLADKEHEHLVEEFLAKWAPLTGALKELPVSDVMARVPILRAENVARAVIEADALSLDAHALLESFRRRLVSGGGRLIGGARVDRIERQPDGWQVGWGRESLLADVVVNAAGAWGDEIAALAGVRPLGIQPMRRTAFLMDPGVDASGWPLVHRVQGGLYFKPEGGQLMVSLAEATPSMPCDAQPEELDLATAADRFERMTTARVRRMTHTWAGLRTFLPDQVPAAGFDPDADGFFWLVGQGGFGIQTAPGLSELAAQLLRGGDHPLARRVDPARVR